MPSARYAPLPNPRTDPDAHNEMEAAFLDSDDEDADQGDQGWHPLRQTRGRNGYQSLSNAAPDEQEESPISPLHTTLANSHAHTASLSAPANDTYDFENVDYDTDWTLQPPPGAPPSPTDALRTFRESQGNSNGMVPDFSDAARQYAQRFGQQRREGAGWLRSMVPEGIATRIGLRTESVPVPVIGGGTNNDGVFANVTAKPSRAIQIQDGALCLPTPCPCLVRLSVVYVTTTWGAEAILRVC